MKNQQDIRILIVEDEGVVALDLRQRLTKLGYHVPATVASGLRAIKLVSEVKPHLILMDIRISGDMDGITTAQHILEQHNIPIIYLTAYADQDTIDRAKATLPYGYIYKPYSEGQLETTIEIALHKHAVERDLQENRERHALIFELTSDFYYLVSVEQDSSLTLEWIDGAVEAITGLKKEEVTSFDVCVRQIAAPDIPGYEVAIQRVLSNQDTIVEYRIETSSGETHWLQDRLKPIWDDGQQRVTRCFGAVRDITAQKQAEVEIRTSEERFRKLVEQAPYAMLIYAPDGSIVLANQALRDFWHLSTEMYAYLLQTYNVLTDEQMRERGTLPLFKKAFSGEAAYIPPFLYEPDDPDAPAPGARESLWSEGFLYPIKDEAGQVVEVVMMQLDVTDRVRAEEESRQQEERFSVAFQAIPAATSLTSLKNGQFIDVNASLLALLGYTREEMIGRTAQDLNLWVNLEDREYMIQALQQHGSVRDLDVQIRAKQGEIRSIYGSAELLSIADEKVIMLSGIDLTERRRIEDALRVSENKYRNIVEQSNDGIVLANDQGIIVDWNRALEQITGVDREQAIGKALWDIQYQALPDEQKNPELHAAMQAQTSHIFAEKDWEKLTGLQEVELQRPDGSQRFVQTMGFVTHGEQGVVVCSIMRDITERHLAEQAQQQYIQRLKVLREIDEDILNAASPSLIAKAVLSNIKNLVPYLRASVSLFDFDAEKFEILAVDDEREAAGREGQVLPLEAYENALELLCNNEPYIMQDLQSQSPLSSLTQQIVSANTRSVMVIPLFYQEQLTGVINIVSAEPDAFQAEHVRIAQDIANPLAIAIEQARLQSELEKYTEELAERVKERTAELQDAYASLQEMSRIRDEFVSNVSHELRTPLANLKVYHDLLRFKPEGVETYLVTLDQETERLRMIVESILQISKLDQEQAQLETRAVNINRLINQFVIDRLLLAEKRGLGLNFAPAKEQHLVNADPDLLGRVINILFTNALNYTPSGGQINFKVALTQHETQRWVSLVVQDTGLGISEADKARLFERFYRGDAALTSNAPGSGLGLSIAQEIIEQHGGQIEIESTGVAGQGTTVTVLLPLHEK